jgi:hypothetical protein
VAPQSSSVLGAAMSIPLTGVAHNALLSDKRVLTIVAREIGRVRGEQ